MSTMTFDLSKLNITAEPVDISPDEYVAPSGGQLEPIKAGTYPAIFIDGKFKTDSGSTQLIKPGSVTSQKNGKTYLQAGFAVKISEGEYKNRILYGRVNTIPFELIFNEVEADRAKLNQYLDYLMAAGWNKALTTSEDYLEALATIVGEETPIRVRTDWSVYCNPKAKDYNGDGWKLRGMKNFPQNSDGSYNPRVDHTLPDGEVVTLLANNDILAIYPAKK